MHTHLGLDPLLHDLSEHSQQLWIRRLLYQACEDAHERLPRVLGHHAHSGLAQVQAPLEQLREGLGVGRGAGGQDVLLVQLLDHLQEETEESKGEREGRNCLCILTSHWRNIHVVLVYSYCGIVLKGQP